MQKPGINLQVVFFRELHELEKCQQPLNPGKMIFRMGYSEFLRGQMYHEYPAISHYRDREHHRD